MARLDDALEGVLGALAPLEGDEGVDNANKQHLRDQNNAIYIILHII